MAKISYWEDDKARKKEREGTTVSVITCDLQLFSSLRSSIQFLHHIFNRLIELVISRRQQQ